MHTQQITLTSPLTRGAFLLACLTLFMSVAMTAHADHPRDMSAYQVDVLLGKATETLVIMQDTVDSGYYDYTKKKESTEPYYDYSKEKVYTTTEYKKESVPSADIELLMKQIKQLQELIMLLMQMQQMSLGYGMKEKQEYAPTVKPSKEASDLMKYADKKDVSDDEMDELQDEWSFVDSSAEILVAGAYQGTLPDGQVRKFQDDREGEITVYVANGSGESLLVLSAYEPTHWKLEGVGLENIQSILLTGYHDQRVTGVPDGVEVIERIWGNGDSPYFILYNGKGVEDDDYPALKEYMKNATGYAPYLFFGEYEADEILVSLKG